MVLATYGHTATAGSAGAGAVVGLGAVVVDVDGVDGVEPDDRVVVEAPFESSRVATTATATTAASTITATATNHSQRLTALIVP